MARIRPRRRAICCCCASASGKAPGWQYRALRRELASLVGEADTHALLSGVSRESELLASLGPVVGLSKVACGEMGRQAYLEQYGHRGPYETEFAAPRPAEDPTWLDQQLALLADARADVAGLLARQRIELEAAWRRFQHRHPGQANTMGRRLENAAQVIRVREAVRSEVARQIWAGRAWALPGH